MARIRTIKPEFFTHSGLGSLSPCHRLLFQGLWTQADRAGRLKDDAKKLKVVLLPWDDVDVNILLQDLNDHTEKFITRYVVKGEKYIQINNFLGHQHPHIKEPESTIPAPCKTGAKTMRAQSNPGGREGKGREGKGREGDIVMEDSVSGTSPRNTHNLTDEEFLKVLKTNPAYSHIDFDVELGKMDAWLLTPQGRGRQKTRRFVVNWLNKIDRPIRGPSKSQNICTGVNPMPQSAQDCWRHPDIKKIGENKAQCPHCKKVLVI